MRSTLRENIVLGIDYGETHIGFAIKSQGTILAVPHSIYNREKGDRDALVSKVKELIAELEVDLVVVGLPLTMEGKPDKMADKVALFIHDLRKETDCRIDQEDERLTSRAVAKHAHDAAAALILQSYIERN